MYLSLCQASKVVVMLKQGYTTGVPPNQGISGNFMFDQGNSLIRERLFRKSGRIREALVSCCFVSEQ